MTFQWKNAMEVNLLFAIDNSIQIKFVYLIT